MEENLREFLQPSELLDSDHPIVVGEAERLNPCSVHPAV